MADDSVRAAIERYKRGQLSAATPGLVLFETRNSRYQLADGVLTTGPNPALTGAVLVGWLIGEVVRGHWCQGAKGVLLLGESAIVTSPTERLWAPEDGSLTTQPPGSAGRPAALTARSLGLLNKRPSAPPPPPPSSRGPSPLRRTVPPPAPSGSVPSTAAPPPLRRPA